MRQQSDLKRGHWSIVTALKNFVTCHLALFVGLPLLPSSSWSLFMRSDSDHREENFICKYKGKQTGKHLLWTPLWDCWAYQFPLESLDSPISPSSSHCMEYKYFTVKGFKNSPFTQYKSCITDSLWWWFKSKTRLKRQEKHYTSTNSKF